MKNLLLLCTALVGQTLANRCVNLHQVFLAIPGDCQNYISCHNGEEYIFACPDSYHFNDKNQLCDFPHNNRACNVICEQSTGVKMQPWSKSCQEYALCVEGVPQIRDCGAGMEFDEVTRTCVKNGNGKCSFNPCTVEQTGQFLPSHRCNEYYTCIPGTTVIQACPEGSGFSTSASKCVPWEESNCNPQGGRSARLVPFPKDDKLPLKPEQHANVACPRIVGTSLYPNPFDCSYYLVCENGDGYFAKCREGTAFDVTAQTCIEASKAVCNTDQHHIEPLRVAQPPARPNPIVPQKPIIPPRPFKAALDSSIKIIHRKNLAFVSFLNINLPNLPAKPEKTCAGILGTKVIVNPYDCRYFLVCDNEDGFFGYCPQNEAFDVYSQKCVDKAVAVCVADDSSVLPEHPLAPAPVNPSPLIPQLPGEHEGPVYKPGLGSPPRPQLPHEKPDSKPATFLGVFKPKPPQNPKPEEGFEVPEFQPGPFPIRPEAKPFMALPARPSKINCPKSIEKQFFPNPYDCSFYLMCKNGVGSFERCPPGLGFDSTLNKCIDATQAKCDMK